MYLLCTYFLAMAISMTVLQDGAPKIAKLPYKILFISFHGVYKLTNTTGGPHPVYHVHKIFHYKPTILGIPHFRKPPSYLSYGRNHGLLHAPVPASCSCTTRRAVPRCRAEVDFAWAAASRYLLRKWSWDVMGWVKMRSNMVKCLNISNHPVLRGIF